MSISTAGSNRYLLHFNSLHSLTQWTAGIRLAMFENTTLQESYTGSLIAGKGKLLNNIKVIMSGSKLKTEDWARVRFGAGTPWRRCWCVITPPDEKESQKLQKVIKKKSAYDRGPPALTGNIKFYDTRKVKKHTVPVATISDVYSAYAIYPQSKPLIDQSTLVKVEGMIRIHTTPESSTEGFVFVMPEVHPAVTGFEMMLRWLFPVYDTFVLYGRPSRLIADTLDTKSLMFAMPQEKRYGYLEILDVATLIHENGSQAWSEKEWRRRLKDLTQSHMQKLQAPGSRPGSTNGTRPSHRNSLPSRTGALRFDDNASIRSNLSLRNEASNYPKAARIGSAPQGNAPFQPPRSSINHQRSVSEATPFITPPRHQKSLRDNQQAYAPSRLPYEATPRRMSYEQAEQAPPPPPAHGVILSSTPPNPRRERYAELDGVNDRSSSESDRRFRAAGGEAQEIQQNLRPSSPPAPVMAPPAFSHNSGSTAQTRAYHAPELRRANSRLSSTTLSQLAEAGHFGSNGPQAAGGSGFSNGSSQQRDGRYSEDQGHRGVIDDASKSQTPADLNSSFEGVVLANVGSSCSTSSNNNNNNNHQSSTPTQTMARDNSRDASPVSTNQLLRPATSIPRSVSPLSQSSTHSSSPTPSVHSSGAIRDRSLYTTPQPNDITQPRPSFHQTAAPILLPKNALVDQSPPEQLQRRDTSHSIVRKPVLAQVQPDASYDRTASLAGSGSDSGSLRQHYIDETALDQVTAHRLDSLTEDADGRHLPSSASSRYDNEPTASPDYANTQEPADAKRPALSIDKPRMGILKTVGTVQPERREVVVGDVHYDTDAPKQPVTSDIPSVDFGPTQVYDPNTSSRPGTSGTLAKPAHNRSKSSDLFIPSPHTGSPGDSQRNSYILNGRASPAFGTEALDRSPGQDHPNNDLHYRTGPPTPNENRRSVAWQPGATVGSGSPANRRSITPEQFVQQRAAATRMTPVYAHARQNSGPPPLVIKNISAEWSAPQHARQTSFGRDQGPRPPSRTASGGVPPPGDLSPHLSAREQEHVARVTGSPLINMVGNPKNQTPQGGGLIGAIEAREKEKKDMKQGLSGQMVQHAIAQRHQQNQNNQHSQQKPRQNQSYQYGQPTPPLVTPQFQMPGQWPQTPGIRQPQNGWNMPQQQYITQTPQQQRVPLDYNTSQAPSPALQPQKYQQWLQQQQYYQQQQYQQYRQQQQQPYGPYFGNGQGRR